MSGARSFGSAFPMQTHAKVMAGVNKVVCPAQCKGPVGDLIIGLPKKQTSGKLPMNGGMPRSVGDMQNLTMEASCQPEKHNAYCQKTQYMLPSFLFVRVDSSAKMASRWKLGCQRLAGQASRSVLDWMAGFVTCPRLSCWFCPTLKDGYLVSGHRSFFTLLGRTLDVFAQFPISPRRTLPTLVAAPRSLAVHGGLRVRATLDIHLSGHVFMVLAVSSSRVQERVDAERRLHPLHVDFLHDCSGEVCRTCLCLAVCHMNRIHPLPESFAHRSQDLPIGDPRRSVRYAATTCLPWRSSSQWLLGSNGAASVIGHTRIWSCGLRRALLSLFASGLVMAYTKVTVKMQAEGWTQEVPENWETSSRFATKAGTVGDHSLGQTDCRRQRHFLSNFKVYQLADGKVHGSVDGTIAKSDRRGTARTTSWSFRLGKSSNMVSTSFARKLPNILSLGSAL